MTIPFICNYPDRGRVMREISRQGVQHAADVFILKGGRFLLEIIEDGKVHLMAVIAEGGGEAKKIAEETCDNGPELLDAVDKLVMAAAKAVGGAFARTEPEKLLVTAH